jgi:hypothetical protein
MEDIMTYGLERKIEQYSFGRLNNEQGNNMTEYNRTLVMLEDLQTYLDSTETPSEALDNLYTHIINTRRAIIHEMEELNND